MHRFFVERKLEIGREIILPPEIAQQIALVLRMKAAAPASPPARNVLACEAGGAKRGGRGEEIALFNGDGFEYLSELTTVSKKETRAKILSCEKNIREPKSDVTLFQAVVKKDKMEWVAEKCTEIGVTKIVPVVAERSVKTGLNETRIKKIFKEAAEQSGRAKVPELDKITMFENALNPAKRDRANKHETPLVLALKIAMEECGAVYVAHEGADLSEVPPPSQTQKIALFVGPEGGFSDAEIQAATALGAKIISLGSTILRAETAAVCGIYRLVNSL